MSSSAAHALKGFVAEVSQLPGGEKILDCIQCGTCSGSCPAGMYGELSPRKIIAMVKADMREEVLTGRAIWQCMSCYSCAARCPKGIKPTDLMYALRRLAIKEGKFPDDMKAPAFYITFAEVVDKFGRSHESTLLRKFYMRTGLFDAMNFMGVGMSMFFRHRVPVFPHKVQALDQLKAIIEKAQAIERS
jgi:heterodisulfide reductase subunit C